MVCGGAIAAARGSVEFGDGGSGGGGNSMGGGTYVLSGGGAAVAAMGTYPYGDVGGSGGGGGMNVGTGGGAYSPSSLGGGGMG